MSVKIKKYAPKILFGFVIGAVLFRLIYNKYKQIKEDFKSIEIETEDKNPYINMSFTNDTALDLSKPFDFIRNEKDINKFAAILINNTALNDNISDNISYEKIAEILYAALIGYIHYEAPDSEKKIDTIIYFVDKMEISENDETFLNATDMIFADLEKYEPNHFAVQKYNEYKSAAGKNENDIINLCKKQLMRLDIKKLNYLVSFDILWDKTGAKNSTLKGGYREL